jgi:hypothetical protein
MTGGMAKMARTVVNAASMLSIGNLGPNAASQLLLLLLIPWPEKNRSTEIKLSRYWLIFIGEGKMYKANEANVYMGVHNELQKLFM